MIWERGKLQRASDGGADVGFILGEQPGEPKVGDFGLHILVEKDVAELDVSVDDSQVRLLVQVGQSLGRAQHDLVPRFPSQYRNILFRCGNPSPRFNRTDEKKKASLKLIY